MNLRPWIIAAVLAAMCVLPAAGQSYRRNKVKTEPEKLVLQKMIFIPYKNQKEILTLLSKWEDTLPEISLSYLERSYYKRPRNIYNGIFKDIGMGGRHGNLCSLIDISAMAEGVELVFHDMFIVYNNNSWQGYLSTSDDRFNRSKLWLAVHKSEFDQARIRASECFDYVASSLESFLNNGGPLEMKRIK